jgi:hypothetical protein
MVNLRFRWSALQSTEYATEAVEEKIVSSNRQDL